MSNSGASTPRAFTSQAATAEDLLKSQTVGLVQLDDFRKRRRDVADVTARDSDGALTPKSEDSDAAPAFKKKKKPLKKVALSFADGDEDNSAPAIIKKKKTSVKESQDGDGAPTAGEDEGADVAIKRKVRPNPNSSLPAPKAVTKASLAAEALERDRLRKEYMENQERVRASDIAIPFVFHDGANIPGGTVRVKKGDHVWLFLERCRKVGAELGVSSDGSVQGGGTKQRAEGRKSWARIGVDDLMLVRGDIIIPHHYEFYYFIAEGVADPTNPGSLLFAYSSVAPERKETQEEGLLRVPKNEKVEGQDDDPTFTKVVDRRWYEKNKHIYPASVWREYKAGKEFETMAKGRRDAQGNTFFFA